jgi:CDGSH-type Zn-finger protein
MPYKDPERQKQAQHENYLRNKEKYYQGTVDRRKRNKKYVDDIKRNSICKCGESRIECLDFHHRYDKKYRVTIIRKDSYSLQTIDEEIDKCDIICANCHRKYHHKPMTDGSHWKNFASPRIKKRQWFIAYIQKQKCVCCGEDDYRCLSFHHIRDKYKGVSDMLNSGNGLKRLQEEIAKCIVLCENCHRAEHYRIKL